MATILVPTDFSENAYNALFYATRLFPEEKCNIILVHSFEDQFSTSTSRVNIGRNDALYDNIEKEVNKQLEKVKDSITLDSATIKLNVDTYCSAQPLFKITNRLIKELEINYVVMGTQGASGLKKIFLGSQAVKLIKKITPIPLCLVPKNTDYVKPTNVAYATDLMSDYSQYSLEIIKEVLRAHTSKLQVVHIYNQTKQDTLKTNYNRLKPKLEDVPYNTHWVSSKETLEEAISQFCDTQKINLLVLVYHKYKWLKRVLKTSLIEKVSFKSPVPLLILPDEI